MNTKLVSYLFSGLLFLAVASGAIAQTTPTAPPSNSPLDRLKTVGTGAGYGEADETTVMEIVGTVINTLLGVLGTVFLILIIVAGFNWMTASGNEEKIKKAADMMRSAVIGLIIVIGAFAIWTFIDRALINGGDTIGNPNIGGS